MSHIDEIDLEYIDNTIFFIDEDEFAQLNEPQIAQPESFQIEPVANRSTLKRTRAIAQELNKTRKMSNLDLSNKRGDRNRSEEERYREKSRSRNRLDSDVESVSSYETDPEPETSFTHYLFLKTDYSLSRLSKKLVQLMANIRLDDDENGFGDETSEDVDFKTRVTKQQTKRNR